MSTNVVEMVADPSECAFDQRCRFGHRVEGHAVYCHNDAWEDGPRKCRRSWYTGGSTKDEDCPGFERNEAWVGALEPTPIAGLVCTVCAGRKRIATDKGRAETCGRCMGDGAEPQLVRLTQYQIDVLETGLMLSHRKTGLKDWSIIMSSKAGEGDEVYKLDTMGLIQIRTTAFAHSGVSGHLFRLTAKGDAVLRLAWAERKTQRGDDDPVH